MKIGYIIWADGYGFLTKDLFWYKCEKPEEAFVHDESILDYLRARSELGANATLVYPACYSFESGVHLTDEPFKFEQQAT